MNNIHVLKTDTVTHTPLLLFDCELRDKRVLRWSSHRVTVLGEQYEPTMLQCNLFEMRVAGEDGIDGVPKVLVTLANVNSVYSQVERAIGWKGAQLVVRFLLYDLAAGVAASAPRVVFRGTGNAAEEIRESSIRLGFVNRLTLQRLSLPGARIQRHCPWTFPRNHVERAEAAAGQVSEYSPFYNCGYAPDVNGGTGNAPGGLLFTSCGYTRRSCEQRGMFDQDASGRTTRRFGGLEFVPPAIAVRTHGERSIQLSAVVENEAKYNDPIPLIYGTAWYQPPLILARNDGNLTHMECLLSSGQVSDVLRVAVNGVELPKAVSGSDMTSTGWFELISTGAREGRFNDAFRRPDGTYAGDPYGGLSVLGIVTPNAISNGATKPRVQVLVRGLKIPVWEEVTGQMVRRYSSNPAWVLLDLLRRSGWKLEDVDLASFARAAAHSDEEISTTDADGRTVRVPRYRANLALTARRSAAEILRGLRAGAGLHLRYTDEGKIEIVVESCLAVQQPSPAEYSNSKSPLNGGWPAFEFSDGSDGPGSILRRADGEPAIRFWCKSVADSPNRFSLEFQDELNGFQQDSLTVTDLDDAAAISQEVAVRSAALGVSNFNQAARVIKRALDRSIRGNLYVEFETGLRAFGVRPGDIVTLTYIKEGLVRQPLRVLGVSPGFNHETAVIRAQWHDDAWYAENNDAGVASNGGGQGRVDWQSLPRPLLGNVSNADGTTDFQVDQTILDSEETGGSVRLEVAFAEPSRPSLTLAAPLVDISPEIIAGAGALVSGQTYYYAISSVSSEGEESTTSFVMRAELPSVVQGMAVKLRNIDVPAGASGFRVYRGVTPSHLARIAEVTPHSSEFVDAGTSSPAGAPTDPSFHHASFYWRFEHLPECSVSASTGNTVTTLDIRMGVDEHAGRTLRVTAGPGKGAERRIASNTEDTLTLTEPMGVTLTQQSKFTVADAAWILGGIANHSPATVVVPNREGAYIQVCGRSANSANQESVYELAPVTRTRLSASGSDVDVPRAPRFSLATSGNGSFELGGIAFDDLTNTTSVTAGTLTVFYFDEIRGQRQALQQPLSANETVIAGESMPAAAGGLIQIGPEIVRVLGIVGGGVEVERGALGSSAEAHASGTPFCVLDRVTHVLSFPKSFFGSPASGTYRQAHAARNIRIAAAEMTVRNVKGFSEARALSYGQTAARGLRTLSGGQFTLQINGFLAIQSGATPPLIIDDDYAVRDIQAFVSQPATLWPIQVEVMRNGVSYCALPIAAGTTASIALEGADLPPLAAGDVLTLDVVSVGQNAGSSPGRDLTVSIRV